MYSCLFIVNMYTNTRLKLLHQFMLYNMKVMVHTKTRTHYETLGIPETATHNEIKSAYYKLTLQYHPDRNKSESAKLMFQKISDAYNILGNHHSRKQYDRTIVIRTKKVDQIYRPAKGSMHRIYDFDEWTNKHYSTIFDHDVKMRKNYFTNQVFRKNQYQYEKDEKNHAYITFTFLSVFTWFLIYISIKSSKDYDKVD